MTRNARIHKFIIQEKILTQAKVGDRVKVHYTGTVDSGERFDTSEGGDPLEFTIGADGVIPGFQRAVNGMSIGEEINVEIAPRDAYGEYELKKINKTDKKNLPQDVEPEVGMMLKAENPMGEIMYVKITEVDETSVTIDSNHPMAGKTLNFRIKLVDIS